MNLFNFIKQYAEQLGGQFTIYDSTKSIIVVPLNGGRFQTLIVAIEKSKILDKHHGVITSKVCEYTSTINLKDLLEQSVRFDYSKFIIGDGHLKIIATFPTEGTSEDEIKHMIMEVAQLGDKFELQITGRDIQ